MILRNPYAFFIKIFKPVHLLMSALMFLLIYKTSSILTFLNNYIYSSSSVDLTNVKETLVNNILFVVPVVLIIFSIIFLGIMLSKKKSILFYLLNIFLSIVVIVITAYNVNFLSIVSDSVLSIKVFKLNHDLVLINLIIEIILAVILLIRGFGIDLKKFNFDSDISKIEINDRDSEEFEVNLKLNIDDKRRHKNKRLRQIKYIYHENKFILLSIIGIFTVLVSLIIVFVLMNTKKVNVENVEYNIGKFSIKVNKTVMLNTNYKGSKITDNELVILDIDMLSYITGVKIEDKLLSLEIEDTLFKPTKKYKNELVDLGNIYEGNELTNEHKNYLLVYEIPEKYIEGDMYLSYNNEGNVTKIKLSPKKLEIKKANVIKKINEKMNFSSSLGDIEFKINKIEINDQYKLQYSYCVKKNNCLNSYEYVKPSIDENFDKTILKLDIEYRNNTKLNINSFYSFFNTYGSIEYKIGNKWYTQDKYFENIKSKKVKASNIVYIGVNSNLKQASNIKLIFKIRDSRYEYNIK